MQDMGQHGWLNSVQIQKITDRCCRYIVERLLCFMNEWQWPIKQMLHVGSKESSAISYADVHNGYIALTIRLCME